MNFVFFILSFNVSLIFAQDAKDLAYSREWLKLLHYKNIGSGNFRSEALPGPFFFSPLGRTNPAAELEAEIVAFGNPIVSQSLYGSLKQPLICAFPARAEFLERKLGLSFGMRHCEIFESWSQAIRAESVSIVYSSAYPSNPASMFGHTLLKLNRATAGTALLSYGVNFSASIPQNENKVRYALFGLFGGYEGRFDLAPYYRKVNEYQISESRDLWEYDLNFSKEETQFLIKHLWELYSDGMFQYFFLNKNCSYQILTLLEAVKPEWNLSDEFSFFALPSETLKSVAYTAKSSIPDYRASLQKQMRKAIEPLTNDERKIIHNIISGELRPGPDLGVPVLDAAILNIKYRQKKSGGKPKFDSVMKESLLARSEAPAAEHVTSAVLNDVDRPDFSHGPSRLALAAGRQDQQIAYRLRGAFFNHDLLNITPAYNYFSELRLLSGELSYLAKSRKMKPNRFDVLHIRSLSGFDSLDIEPSWFVSSGWTSGKWRVSGGYGLSFFLLSKSSLLYLMPAADIGDTQLNYRTRIYSLGSDIGLLLKPKMLPFALEAGLGYRNNFNTHGVFKLTRFAYQIAKRMDLRVNWRKQGSRESTYDVEVGWMF